MRAGLEVVVEGVQQRVDPFVAREGTGQSQQVGLRGIPWWNEVPIFVNEVVSEIDCDYHEVDGLLIQEFCRAAPILRGSPPVNPRIPHRDGSVKPSTQTRLDQPGEALLVLDLECLHEGISKQEDLEFAASSSFGPNAKTVFICEDADRALARIDARAQARARNPAETIMGNPYVRAHQDQLLW
jgi:hypothetical protein